MTAPDRVARFVTGSTMRHVVVMTLTASLGLMATFLVDLADLFFLGLLKQTEVTAAIGYAGTLVFANLSLAIGAGIAASALVARNLGAGDVDRAQEFATSGLMFSGLVSLAITSLCALGAPWLLALLGATGEARHLAQLFIWTASPGFVLLSLAIACSFILRGIGDPKRAMYITLSAAILTAITDPIFILGLGWGIQGAAVANVLADLVACLMGLAAVARVHRFILPLSFAGLRRDLPGLLTIALPVMLTQLAAPFTIAYTTRVLAPYGDAAVAASAIVGRIIPVAFGVIFALSGAVGPIIGQNYGARHFNRVRQTLYDGLAFAALYTLVVALILFLLRYPLANAFHASGRTVELVVFFCTYIGITWAFAGAQFVANAAFNNLRRPNLSTWFNWGKATLGTIPFALYGAHVAGPEGMMAAVGVGSVIFGIASVAAAFHIVNRLEHSEAEAHAA